MKLAFPCLVLLASANSGFLVLLSLRLEIRHILSTFEPSCLFPPPGTVSCTWPSFVPPWWCWPTLSRFLHDCKPPCCQQTSSRSDLMTLKCRGLFTQSAPISSSNIKILTLPPTHRLLQFQGTPQRPFTSTVPWFYTCCFLHLVYLLLGSLCGVYSLSLALSLLSLRRLFWSPQAKPDARLCVSYGF